MTTSLPVRVLIVEDSAVVRQLLTHIIAGDPRLQVVGAVSNAEEAISRLPELKPDVISMDIRLPGIDGLEATRQIMADHPTPIVVISGSVEPESLYSSMNALRAGALSVVEKPVGGSNEHYAAIAQQIRTQLYIMSQVAVVRRRMRPRPPVPTAAPRRPAIPPRIMVVASSTGGPQALAKVFAGLPADWPLPILLVQHMGAPFMPGFAAWLDSVVPQRVALGKQDMKPLPGTITVAPGDRHLRIGRDGRLRTDDDPAIGGQRPAANALFTSAADVFGGATIGVVLTGMGDDGAAGVRQLVHCGATVLAEHENTAVVYGMPAAAARHGAMTLPLDLMAPHLIRLLNRNGES